jgi:hypothetical protein
MCLATAPVYNTTWLAATSVSSWRLMGLAWSRLCATCCPAAACASSGQSKFAIGVHATRLRNLGTSWVMLLCYNVCYQRLIRPNGGTTAEAPAFFGSSRCWRLRFPALCGLRPLPEPSRGFLRNYHCFGRLRICTPAQLAIIQRCPARLGQIRVTMQRREQGIERQLPPFAIMASWAGMRADRYRC